MLCYILKDHIFTFLFAVQCKEEKNNDMHEEILTNSAIITLFLLIPFVLFSLL